MNQEKKSDWGYLRGSVLCLELVTNVFAEIKRNKRKQHVSTDNK